MNLCLPRTTLHLSLTIFTSFAPKLFRKGTKTHSIHLFLSLKDPLAFQLQPSLVLLMIFQSLAIFNWWIRCLFSSLRILNFWTLDCTLSEKKKSPFLWFLVMTTSVALLKEETVRVAYWSFRFPLTRSFSSSAGQYTGIFSTLPSQQPAFRKCKLSLVVSPASLAAGYYQYANHFPTCAFGPSPSVSSEACLFNRFPQASPMPRV